ncbi:MAG: endonuclease III [Oscillospiraceae bacterium]|nr:endonuclease III [Oscillospiraceae bacterium]
MREKAAAVTRRLEAAYPEAICSLEYTDPFQLLVATRLSAQCTDARVNQVTPALFARFPGAAEMAGAAAEEVEALIHSCGFYHTKSRDLIGMAQMILARHGGQVPQSMEELTALPGVGRKTANLIRGDVFRLPAVVADTHLIRIANLLGLVRTQDPAKVERSLIELLDPARSNDFCHRCVLHGRAVCVARRPRCGDCCLAELCASFAERQEAKQVL